MTGLNSTNQKLIDFLKELQILMKDTFGVVNQAIIEQFMYAIMSPHLKKSINWARLENDTNEQIVSHVERKLQLNGLHAPDELQITIVTQQVTKQNLGKPKPTCHNCKKPSHYRNQCHQLKRGKDQTRNNMNSAGNNNNNNNGGQTNSNSNNKISNITNPNQQNNLNEKKPRPVYPPCETCGKANLSTEKCYFRVNVANGPPPRNG